MIIGAPPTYAPCQADFMSCESGGVKVDHACSGPNSGPMVDSFCFENRPLQLSSLECGLAPVRGPSSLAPGSPSQSRITGMSDASGASSVQLTVHGLAAMISTAASGQALGRNRQHTWRVATRLPGRRSRRMIGHNVDNGAARLAKHQARSRRTPLARRVPPPLVSE
jgi:hypothetical protein